MDAIIAIWALSLVLALVVTVPILAVVVRFIHHAREIDRLATVTLKAAGGIAGNTANIAMLDELLRRAGALAETSGAIDGVAGRIHGQAGGIVRALSVTR